MLVHDPSGPRAKKPAAAHAAPAAAPVAAAVPAQSRAGARQRPPPSPVEPGEVLGGKYRVEKVIGYGGMGVVVAATHLALERLVALKIMRSELCRDEAAHKRFLREARAAARLGGPHVARVIDVGTIESRDLGGMEVPCIVMEYLDGEDLAAHLAHRGHMPVPEIADLALQACDALDEAHAASLVHRDLKPANLFLSKRADGSAFLKVLDFGITKDARAEMRLTKANDTIGSPLYVAPEQLVSPHDVDARADIWALGVILYEAVAGVSPFKAKSAQAIVAGVLQAKYRPLSEVAGPLPRGFEAVVTRCLDKDPARRYPSAAALARDLKPFAPTTRAMRPVWERAGHAPAASAAGRAATTAHGRSQPRWVRWMPVAAIIGAASLPFHPRMREKLHLDDVFASPPLTLQLGTAQIAGAAHHAAITALASPARSAEALPPATATPVATTAAGGSGKASVVTVDQLPDLSQGQGAARPGSRPGAATSADDLPPAAPTSARGMH